MDKLEAIFQTLLTERKRDYKQREIAEKMGVLQNSISIAENKTRHTLEFVERYANAMGYAFQFTVTKFESGFAD